MRSSALTFAATNWRCSPPDAPPIVEELIDALIAGAVRAGPADRDRRRRRRGRRHRAVLHLGRHAQRAPTAASPWVPSTTVIGQIGRAMRHKSGPHAVVMRSTVPPGTAEDRVIPLLEQTSGRRLGNRLVVLQQPGIPARGLLGPRFPRPSVHTDRCPCRRRRRHPARTLRRRSTPRCIVAPIRVAESVKHISNVFHAVKLAFANEAGAILAANGVDAREAFRLLCEDRVLNISSAYLRPGFAFGGSCLPKDVRSFLALADRHAPVRAVAEAVAARQPGDHRPRFRGGHAAWPAAGRLFGLAFKQGTDDLRESPFVLLAERLLGRGYDLRIYDRSVQVARLMGSNRTYIDREIPHLERLMVVSPEAALSGAERRHHRPCRARGSAGPARRHSCGHIVDRPRRHGRRCATLRRHHL